jgi:hypothetical protein
MLEVVTLLQMEVYKLTWHLYKDENALPFTSPNSLSDTHPSRWPFSPHRRSMVKRQRITFLNPCKDDRSFSPQALVVLSSGTIWSFQARTAGFRPSVLDPAHPWPERPNLSRLVGIWPFPDQKCGRGSGRAQIVWGARFSSWSGC